MAHITTLSPKERRVSCYVSPQNVISKNLSSHLQKRPLGFPRAASFITMELLYQFTESNSSKISLLGSSVIRLTIIMAAQATIKAGKSS